MSENIKAIANLEEAKGIFIKKYKSFKNTFKTILDNIRFSDVPEEKKKSFIQQVEKNINVFFYPNSVEKKTLIFYMNFGKNNSKLTKLFKIDGKIIFKEDTANSGFGNQISINFVDGISPYLNYLLNYIYNQFQLINIENIKQTNGPLVIFDKKVKTLMIEKKLCPVGKKFDAIVKGLGATDFVSFGIKSVDLEITFKTISGMYMYKCDKQQFKKMFDKENHEKKKGLDCKELLKWVEKNKMNEQRTKYFIVPSQITVDKKEHKELTVAKKIISQIDSSESAAEFAEEFEAYVSQLSTNTKIATFNLKFTLMIKMKIDVSTCENTSDLDDLAAEIGENETETFEEKEEEILLLHKDFLKRFKHCIAERNITSSASEHKNLPMPSSDDISNAIKIEKPAPPTLDEDDDEASDVEED